MGFGGYYKSILGAGGNYGTCRSYVGIGTSFFSPPPSPPCPPPSSSLSSSSSHHLLWSSPSSTTTTSSSFYVPLSPTTVMVFRQGQGPHCTTHCRATHGSIHQRVLLWLILLPLSVAPTYQSSLSPPSSSLLSLVLFDWFCCIVNSCIDDADTSPYLFNPVVCWLLFWAMDKVIPAVNGTFIILALVVICAGHCVVIAATTLQLLPPLFPLC